jgi:hypothetical protein
VIGRGSEYSSNGTSLSCSLRRCTLREDGIENSLWPVNRTLYLVEFSKCQTFKGNEFQKMLELSADKLFSVNYFNYFVVYVFCFNVS